MSESNDQPRKMSRRDRRAMDRARVKERHDADYWLRMMAEIEDPEFLEFQARELYGLTAEEGRAQTERMIREAIGDREVNIEEAMKLCAAWEGKTVDQVRRENADSKRRFEASRRGKP